MRIKLIIKGLSMIKTFRLLVRGVVIAFYLVLINVAQPVLAMEFQKEADKAKWIKEFFKDKEFEPKAPQTEEDLEFVKKQDWELERKYGIKSNPIQLPSKEELEFEAQLLKDFITQNGIEHIEPIAVGKSINDPEIAKFNTACPDKKPIDLYKSWTTFGSVIQYPATEEELEDPKGEDDFNVTQKRCTGDMKIYKFNLHNTPDDRQDYVLYCDNLRTERFAGKTYDVNRKLDPFDVLGAYLQFDPKKCLYPYQIYLTPRPLIPNDVSGIFKYKGEYYLFSIGEVSGEEVGIKIRRENTTPVSTIYLYYTKPLKEIKK
jgi:hypothetical protein